MKDLQQRKINFRNRIDEMMRDIDEHGRVFVTESSLSRISRKTEQNSAGIITAFRGYNTRKENMNKNRQLYADLMRMDRHLGITKLVGGYIENYGEEDAYPVKEEVYFVTSSQHGDDNGYLEGILTRLGRKYDQDSIAVKNYSSSQWILIGTNNAQFPGLNKRVPVGNYTGGKTGEFFTRVRNRPFVFESGEIMIPPTSAMGLRALKEELNKIDEEFGTDW